MTDQPARGQVVNCLTHHKFSDIIIPMIHAQCKMQSVSASITLCCPMTDSICVYVRPTETSSSQHKQYTTNRESPAPSNPESESDAGYDWRGSSSCTTGDQDITPHSLTRLLVIECNYFCTTKKFTVQCPYYRFHNRPYPLKYFQVDLTEGVRADRNRHITADYTGRTRVQRVHSPNPYQILPDLHGQW